MRQMPGGPSNLTLAYALAIRRWRVRINTCRW